MKTTNTTSQPITNSNNQDLLDLLGGLDVSPAIPTTDTGLNFISENNNPTIAFNNTNSNFLTGDFFSTNTIKGKEIRDFKKTYVRSLHMVDNIVL